MGASSTGGADVSGKSAMGTLPGKGSVSTLSRSRERVGSFNPIGSGSGRVETLSRTSTKKSDFNPTTPGSGSPVETLSRTTTPGPGAVGGGESSPTLKLTPDGLLLMNDNNRGGQMEQPQPTTPQEPATQPAPQASRQRAASLARPRVSAQEPRTLLTLSLADVTRKSLLGI